MKGLTLALLMLLIAGCSTVTSSSSRNTSSDNTKDEISRDLESLCVGNSLVRPYEFSVVIDWTKVEETSEISLILNGLSSSLHNDHGLTVSQLGPLKGLNTQTMLGEMESSLVNAFRQSTFLSVNFQVPKNRFISNDMKMKMPVNAAKVLNKLNDQKGASVTCKPNVAFPL